MAFDINVGGKEETTENERFNKDINSWQENAHYWISNRPFMSAITLILTGLAIYWVIPWGFLAILPSWIARYLKLGIYGAIPAYIFARRLVRRFYTEPIDIIEVADISNKQRTKRFAYERGKFAKEYDFEVGEPATWLNHKGLRVYQVTELDRDQKEARSDWISDMDDWKILKFREAWEAQRIWNDKQRKKAAEFELQLEQHKSKTRAAVSNSWLRNLEEIEFEDSINQSANEALPDTLQEQEDLDSPDLMEDLESPNDALDKLRSEINDEQE